MHQVQRQSPLSWHNKGEEAIKTLHRSLVLLLGIGGIGKSTLAAKLVQQIQTEFEVVVWRSLQNAPPFEEWLETVLPLLLRAQGEDIAVPSSLHGKLLKLRSGLRQKCCLLILDNIETMVSRRRLPDAMQSLLRRCLIETAPRSLIEKEGERFFPQPVVLEYVTDRFVQCIAEEIASQTPERLKTHALISAQAKDYIREMQKRLMVEPIAEQLQLQFSGALRAPENGDYITFHHMA